MPLKIHQFEDLDSVDFSKAKKAPLWVDGRGQRVEWKHCFVWEYDSSNTNSPKKQHPECSGWAIVENGTDIYLGGRGVGNI